MGTAISTTNQATYDGLWGDLFHDFDTNHTIRIEIDGTSKDSNSLVVKHDDEKLNVIKIKEMTAAPMEEDEASGVLLPITFTYSQHGQQTRIIRPRGRNGKVELGNVQHKTKVAFYSSAFPPTVGPIEPAHQFSDFSKRKQSQAVVDAFKKVFPDLEGALVEIQSGIEMVFGDVPWIPVKLPVAMMSGGLNKMVAILLGIATQEKGVVLIDELENGIYYRMLPRVGNDRGVREKV